jgi:lipopolysaccharide transport system permease protein
VSPWWLLTPVLVVAISILAVAASNPLAALNVYYRDFRFALAFVIQLWLFASPVAYPLAVVPEQWQELYAALNPAAGILDSFSHVLAAGVAPDWTLLGISLLSTLVVGVVGYRIFMRLEPGFADVI